MEAPFRSLSLNIINEFDSYIEQIENPGYSLQSSDLFRELVVHRDLECNLSYLELQFSPDMEKKIFRMRESRRKKFLILCGKANKA